MKKDVPWNWDASRQKAYDTLKSKMQSSVALAFPNHRKPVHVHIDASDVALGATLSQEDDLGGMRLVACMSKKLHQAQKNYPAHERELLALVNALEYWRPYLYGKIDTVVYTDSTFLTHLRTQKLTPGRQLRWLQEIENFSPIIKHIPGTTNLAADALSRPVDSILPIYDPQEDWTPFT